MATITRNALLALLKAYHILDDDLTLNVKYAKRLNALPQLLQHVLTATSFLLYSAPIKARLHCVILGIVDQPRCCVCHNIVKMRLSGRYIYTFPMHCSIQCVNDDPVVEEKRRLNVMQKHGVDHIFKSFKRQVISSKD